ncbi:MAG: hypothetical protein GTO08_09285 [Deltaproteobacteria bacterium]|nr:hypothetical protein [Deltaproteobacteria bacterium]
MDEKWRLVSVLSRTGELLTEAHLLSSFSGRFFGLAFKDLQRITRPAVLYPCRSIHTFFMRFPLDAFFVSASGNVVKIIRNIPPNRVVLPVHKARLVIEMPAEKVYLPDVESVYIPDLIANSP